MTTDRDGTSARQLDRLFALLAAAALLAVGWWPQDGHPNRAFGIVATLPALLVLAGTFLPARGQAVGISLLWAAWGTAWGVAAIGLFGLGLVGFAGPLLTGLALATTPNRVPERLKFDWRYVVVFAAAFWGMLLLLFV